MTVREGPHWHYDRCDQGHDYERYGDDIAWEMCARCGHCRYTREHRVAVAREQEREEGGGMSVQQTAPTCHCSACGVGVAGDADTRRWDEGAPLCEPCWRWLRAERLAQREGER